RSGHHPFEREITQRVGIDELANLFYGHLRRDQVCFVWRVDSVIAWAYSRRTTDAYMDLFRSGFAHHAHNLLRSCPAHDRIIDQYDASAFDQIAHRVEFNAHTE